MTSIPGHTRREFADDLLARLGFRATHANRHALLAWMQAEGGSAAYNPLNTTQPASGASDYNSVGVKNYTSYDQGLSATVETLRNGHYGPILRALRAGKSAMDVARAVAKTPWGTGSGVVRVLGGTVESGGTKVAGGGKGTKTENAGLTDSIPGAGPLIGFLGGLNPLNLLTSSLGKDLGKIAKQGENWAVRTSITAIGVTAGLALVVLGIYHGVQKPDDGAKSDAGGSGPLGMASEPPAAVSAPNNPAPAKSSGAASKAGALEGGASRAAMVAAV